MKRFIKKIILLVLLVTICFSGIVAFDFFIIGSQYKYNYQASLIDKVNRLKSINEPKIILVGHSNLSFGINSKMIEDSFDMPVVNLGLHGSLGNAFHEEIAKLNINEGDIVVICHSTFSDDDAIGDPALAWITYDYNEEIWPIIRKKDYKQMLLAYPDYMRSSYILWLTNKGNADIDSCYSRTAFNEYGDVIYKPEKGQVDIDTFFAKTSVNVPQINDTCTNRLNELNQYITEQGATMVVAGYPIAYGEYSDFTETDFENFQNELDNELDCEIISDYTDYFYPYKYFYNTVLHLTEEGTEIRTNQLISDIQNWKDKR